MSLESIVKKPRGLKDPATAISRVQNAFFKDIPELEELYKSPKENKDEAARLIRDKIGKNINQYFENIGIPSIGRQRECPFFEGDSHLVITKSFAEFGFDANLDLGKNYEDWEDDSQAVANVQKAMLHDIEGLRELWEAAEPWKNKGEAARLIRDKIGKNINQYFENIGISTAGREKQCPFFEGDRYLVITKSFPEFGFDVNLDLDKDYDDWEDSVQAVANVRKAMENNISELAELSDIVKKDKSRASELKVKAARLIKNKINGTEGGIACYFENAGIKSAGNQRDCPAFGSYYSAIVKSFAEFGFDENFDLNAPYTGWKDNEKAIKNVRKAINHSLPEFAELVEAVRVDNSRASELKVKAARLIRDKIAETKEGIQGYFENMGIYAAGQEEKCPFFKGDSYSAIVMSFPEFGFDESDIHRGKNIRFYDFGYGLVKFGSNPERVVGILLDKYGIVKKFVERKNLHVKTSKDTKHDMDFLVGNTFIEYHPVNAEDWKQGRRTPEAVGEYKRRHITKPEYQKTWFWHMWEVDQLYDILMDSAVNPLMKNSYRNLSKEQLKKDVKEAYKLAAEYDAAHEDPSPAPEPLQMEPALLAVAAD